MKASVVSFGRPEGHLALKQAVDVAWDEPAGVTAQSFHLNCSRH